MKILMLGWEYPPHIAGGLGTACEGLTRGLARQGIEVIFVIPRVFGDEDAGHMALLAPGASVLDFDTTVAWEIPELFALDEVCITRYGIPAFLMPYWTAEEYTHQLAVVRSIGVASPATRMVETAKVVSAAAGQQYAGDIFQEVAEFTRRTVGACRRLVFDAIHAHDWMTMAAGVALKRLTGKPLIVHVHSLEYDRSGMHVNPRIHQIEGYGIGQADAVIAVSHYTKQVICREHGAPPERVHVVHNGIYPKQAVRHYREKHPEWPGRMVLFLGRVTFQKGPDYFVRAAARVIPHAPDVRFVLAGSGDMLEQVKELARTLEIDDHFVFPGFLRGNAVEEIFSMADLYVMPSVSEPFGIAALEAINFDVPALISRQSGVSEVVDHSLKFDFWDVDRLADLIINGLEHEELRADMVESAKRELTKLRWDASASKAIAVYEQLLN